MAAIRVNLLVFREYSEYERWLSIINIATSAQNVEMTKSNTWHPVFVTN